MLCFLKIPSKSLLLQSIYKEQHLDLLELRSFSNSQSQMVKNQYQIKVSTSVICWIIPTKNSHSHTIACDSCKVIRFIVDFGQASSKMEVLIVCLLRKHKQAVCVKRAVFLRCDVKASERQSFSLGRLTQSLKPLLSVYFTGLKHYL